MSEGRESAEERCAACDGSCILVNCAGLGGAALVGIFWRGSLRRLGGPLAIEVACDGVLEVVCVDVPQLGFLAHTFALSGTGGALVS